MSEEDFYPELMKMCVHQAAAMLGADADQNHITFEARVLFGMLLGWQSHRSFTHH